MDQQSIITPIDKDVAHKAHVHFYDYIQSFHGLKDQPEYDAQKNEILNKLRHQYLQDNNWEQKICLRDCFKLNTRNYVEFCLDRRCGGVDFMKAASQLGYVKH